MENKELIISTLQKKCEFKNIPVPTLDAIMKHRLFGELNSEWANMLQHQLTVLPPIDSFFGELPDFFDWLNETQPIEEMEDTTGSPEIPFITLKDTDQSWTPPVRLTVISPDSSNLEKIRFAAANRLCLDLAYNRERRIIEPYEVRRKIDGSLYLMAIRVDNRENRNYSFNKIEDIKITSQSFLPQFPVQITATGQLLISQNAVRARKASLYRGVVSQ